MEQPNYYAIIPASIRYDSEITDFAKILYAEITALSNKQGFCSASNGYFAELYRRNDSTISETISSLTKRGHIRSEVQENYKRKIYPLVKIPKGGTEKAEGGVSGKAEENNTSINTKYNTGETKFRIEKDSPKKEEKESKVKYPNAKQVFALFPKPQKSWAINTTELKHGELLFERGLDKVKRALDLVGKFRGEDYFPQVTCPSELERKWPQLVAYKNKHEH